MPHRKAVTAGTLFKAKRRRFARAIHTEAAASVLAVRAYFGKESGARKSFNLFRPAQRTAEATGMCPVSITRSDNEEYAASLPEDGTPETHCSSRRVPQEELVRVRKTILAQYNIPTFPTLDSILAYLKAPPVDAQGAGAGPDAGVRSGANAGAGASMGAYDGAAGSGAETGEAGAAAAARRVREGTGPAGPARARADPVEGIAAGGGACIGPSAAAGADAGV